MYIYIYVYTNNKINYRIELNDRIKKHFLKTLS